MTIIPVYQYAGQDLAVMGLGKTGLASARALRATGTRVHVWDDNAALREKAQEEGLDVTNLADLSNRRTDWSQIRALVWSPGIPHTYPRPHPVARIARERGVPLFCDIELLFRAERDCFFVGITGTNGKSTCTSLVGHLLRAGRLQHQVGGNLGMPALSLRPQTFHGTYVLELSSYQLELAPSLACDVAVLLNISPDHLDRHGGMDGYVAAKTRIFHGGERPRTSIIGIDDDYCREIWRTMRSNGNRRVVPVAIDQVPQRGIGVIDGQLFDDMDGRRRRMIDLTTIPTLPGAHNWQNAAAAYAAARARGVDPKVIVEALPTFPGLPHRQEMIAEIAGVKFINDSKATNADAADKALGCYDAVYWIAGGKPKDTGLDGLEIHFDRVRHAYLIGEAAQSFEGVLRGKVATTRSGTLDKAVKAAAKDAWAEGHKNAVVLLSPACASFDQFANFEARGDAFRAAVAGLGKGPKGGRK